MDFLQEKKGVPCKVETIEYDPYRTAFIAKVIYADGDRRYLIAPAQAGSRAKIITSLDAPLELGNRTILKKNSGGCFRS